MKQKVITLAALTAGAIGYYFGRSHLKEAANNRTFPLRPGVPEQDPESVLGCDQSFTINPDKRVNVLITGAGSYIGTSFADYVEQRYGDHFNIHTLGMRDDKWREHSFKDESGRPFDTVFHVAGIAHTDVGHATDAEIEQYYIVNTDLAIECARKSREAGCHQFIFMSSMIVYGDCSFAGGKIDRGSKPNPANFYGDSKWQADKGIRSLHEPGKFETAVLRPPMIYGKGSKGNYPTLSKLAKRLPFFPDVKNTRSMLYIENLCEFLCVLILSGRGGVYFPQNREYSNTSALVKMIGAVAGKKVHISKMLTPGVWLVEHVPVNKIKNLASKAFGSSYYDQQLSVCKGLDCQMVSLDESIRRTES